MPRRTQGDSQGEITVFPRAPSADIGSIPPPESGLSIEPEDLGAQFLSNATEQRSSEWPPSDGGGEGDDDWTAEAASFELDPDGWERAITRSLRLGKLSAAFPKVRTGARRIERSLPDEPPDTQWGELDLTDENIHEASLLDHEGRELGDVESPALRTDDTHSHGRPRGGHAPHARRKRA